MSNDNIQLTTNKTSNSKGFKRLLNFFRIGNSDKGYIVPTEPSNRKNKRLDGKYKPIEFPTSIQKAYEYFVSNMNLGIYQSNKFRFERYKDMKYAVTESAILNTAVQVYVSEAFSPKDNQKAITINAKDKKIEKLFYKWLVDVGVTDNFCRNVFYNLTVYGDNFWVNQIDLKDGKGITSLVSLDPFLVKDRLEFNVGVVNQQKQWSQSSMNLVNTYGSLKQIYDTLEKGGDLEDFSQFYKSYLMGYELKINAEDEDGQKCYGVPPWAITHCRMFTTENDFFPFGKPPLLNAISQYKSYKTTQMLIDMLRVATFPREVVKIKNEENMDVFSRMQRVDEVRQFIDGITPKTNGKDDIAVGERIYTCDDLFDYDLIDPDIDMDKLGDLEMKESELVMSTGIPDSYLIPSQGAGDLGGENAESLYYLNKIFQRRCDSLRDAFLEGLEESFRMHLLLTDVADGDKTEFELSMPSNTEDWNDDKISRDSDFLTLATDILSNLGQMVGLDRGDKLPDSVIKDVLKRYMPIEPATLNKWIDELTKASDEQEDENEENETSGEPLVVPTGNQINAKGKSSGGSKSSSKSGSSSGSSNVNSSSTTSVTKTTTVKTEKVRMIEEKLKDGSLIREAYFKSKEENGFANGLCGKRYFVNHSKNPTKSITCLKEQLMINKKEDVKSRLTENK